MASAMSGVGREAELAHAVHCSGLAWTRGHESHSELVAGVVLDAAAGTPGAAGGGAFAASVVAPGRTCRKDSQSVVGSWQLEAVVVAVTDSRATPENFASKTTECEQHEGVVADESVQRSKTVRFANAERAMRPVGFDVDQGERIDPTKGRWCCPLHMGGRRGARYCWFLLLRPRPVARLGCTEHVTLWAAF